MKVKLILASSMIATLLSFSSFAGHGNGLEVYGNSPSMPAPTTSETYYEQCMQENMDMCKEYSDKKFANCMKNGKQSIDTCAEDAADEFNYCVEDVELLCESTVYGRVLSP